MTFPFLHPAGWIACGVLLFPMAEGQYEARSLRSDLSPLPYYATGGGREGRRFTEAAVNRYRLYDFYARQADYHLANPSDRPDPLPPFPELDGGRRGHWGGTNDRDSGAYDRPAGPDFTTVTSRLGTGLFHVLSGPAEDPAVIVFDGISGSFAGFIPQGRLSVPQHNFGFAVDRFGFQLDVAGKPSFSGTGGDWLRGGENIGRFTGYHVDGSSVVFRSELAGAQLLERPSVVLAKSGSQRFFARDLEFRSGTQYPVDFRLPRIADLPKGSVMKWSVEPAGRNQDLFLRGQTDGTVCFHRFIAGGGLKIEPHESGDGVRLTVVPVGGRLFAVSWSGPESESAPARAELAAIPIPAAELAPGTCLRGGPSRFPEIIKVEGVLDADPASRGAAYAIDDIPLPTGNNPYHTPMTLSGLAFAADGTAYASTLVGDVWKITGLEGDLKQVEWKRYASGLDLPMGIEVAEGVPHVNARRFIFRLVDLNGDGEADLYERFSREDIPHPDECGRDLKRDAAGNFHFNARAGTFRLSADGGDLTRTGEGSRNPLGLAVRKDGLVLSDSSEGDRNNGTCTIYEADHPENQGSSAKRRRILYLPRGVDNSPGGRLFMDDSRFGPLGQAILGTSYGTGTWYYIVRDPAEGTPQAAMVPMPGNFSSGVCRVAMQPKDGQVFVAGLDGWGDYASTEGCLHRIRWTGREATVLTSWRACRNGLLLRFNGPLDSLLPAPENWFVQQWNYVDSLQTYGSAEYSVKSPGKLGHDRLEVRSVRLADDGALFLEIPGLLPSMCLQVHANLRDAKSQPWRLDAYLTLSHLMADHPAAPAASRGKPVILSIPEQTANGDTYQGVVTYFDQLYGRATADRPESAAVSYRREELSYTWLRKNLIDSQCMPCHGAGTQHDFSTYGGLMKAVDLKHPEKSPLLGMLATKSMPPYPLPSVPSSTREAVREWILQGARK
ncbi:hypothetical protein OKA05_15600 [Luteolibacter arcticus]|uniref:Hydrazine synthase alpha subunit middle domain-containing protein n=1 Tax=Luteolibacter arcticus TaxID=1581411 RepID=A0ABT3GKF5_9BACT|nr:hypothetical protein [Luteolibacter arcticus]MCW1923992.1 hypothetical protein [Luteolibacter arcticus]